MPLLGIDLGTTNTVVSVDKKICALADSGRTTLPSVVAFLPNGKRNVGEIARRRRAIDCPNTIYSSKRIIGRRFDDSVTQNFRKSRARTSLLASSRKCSSERASTLPDATQ